MEINFLQITEDNLNFFMPVIPDGLEIADNRVSIGAFDEDEGCLGAVSFSLVGFEYVIDWIYVDEEFRLRGIGKALINKVIDIVMKTGDRYPITARFEYDDENSLYAFFLSLPDVLTDFSHKRYYITPSDIRDISSLHKSSGKDVSTERFFDRPLNEQKRILAKLEYEETYTVSDYDKWKENCEQNLCLCVFAKNSLLDLIIMTKLPGGNLELSYLYGKYPKGLMELLSDAVAKIELFFPGAQLTFDAMNEASTKMADHLFPKAKTALIYEAEY